ncbi:putative transporter [Roseovarius litorisediminis]|uniref:Putative transporter n=2 Tax=Roseovarius litorisediminis TaxID=1312363 RepID=A0A1Y5TR52_9RHOB|nr:putative transporter [Roseovarius litorisediminis]
MFGVGFVVIAITAVTLSISFAALVYTGPLSVFLGQGINATLLGAAIMALVGSFFLSVRGSICNPQDVTAVLIGAAAAGIATTGNVPVEHLFPTVIGLIVTTGIFTGLVVFLAGAFKLSALVRYAPYPVIAGFLAATGYLLFMGALSIAARETVSISNLTMLFHSVAIIKWVPWVAGAIFLTFIERRQASELTVPTVLSLSVLAFFALLGICGYSLSDAMEMGLLLGPFDNTSFSLPYNSDFFAKIEWAAIASAAPTLIAVSGLTLLGALLNGTGIAMTLGAKFNSEQDMKATGLANVASATVAGLPGYVILGESILARRMGLRGQVPSLASAAGCLAALYFSADILAYMPAGLLVMAVAYLGFDLLATWLWESRNRLSRFEYGIVVLIVAIAATVGFLLALAVGMLAAIAIFIVSYANTEVILSRSTGATRRSRVERSEEESDYLSKVGSELVVLDLTGYLFFGTAHRLSEAVQSELSSERPIKYLILDFRRVPGIDTSATNSLAGMLETSEQAGVKLFFTGMSEDVEKQFALASPHNEGVKKIPNIDAALEIIEGDLLSEEPGGARVESARLMQLIERLEVEYHEDPGALERITLAPGEKLIRLGTISSECYFLLSGTLRAEIEDQSGNRVRVAEFQPCALVGEIAYYAEVPRTAWVIASTDSKVVRVDLKRMERAPTQTLIEFHKAAARSLARRVMRMTRLTSEL